MKFRLDFALAIFLAIIIPISLNWAWNLLILTGKIIWIRIYKTNPKYYAGKVKDLGESISSLYAVTGLLILWLIIVIANLFI
jgi:hypothetical protein